MKLIPFQAVYPQQLYGGQQQRLALARTLISKNKSLIKAIFFIYCVADLLK